MLYMMYVALGICLMMAAKDPLHNAIIIDYTVISSFLHGGYMLYAAIDMWDTEHLHLVGDVPMLLTMAVVLSIYHPRRLARSES